MIFASIFFSDFSAMNCLLRDLNFVNFIQNWKMSFFVTFFGSSAEIDIFQRGLTPLLFNRFWKTWTLNESAQQKESINASCNQISWKIKFFVIWAKNADFVTFDPVLGGLKLIQKFQKNYSFILSWNVTIKHLGS